MSTIPVPEFLKRSTALASLRALGIVATLTLALVGAAGIAVTFSDPRDFSSVWDGWWWAASTITTVGYGDFVPHSNIGRLTGVCLMFGGIALLSILTAALASVLLAEEVGDEERHIDRELAAMRRTLERIESALDEQKHTQ